MAVSFNLPDPYEAQRQDIARRQAYAQALQQQAFQPIETSSYQGIQAPIPATAVLAKALQGFGGGMLAAQAGKEQRELREGDIAKSAEFTAALSGAKTPEERQALALRALGGEFGQRGQMIGGATMQMAQTEAEKAREREFRAEQAAATREQRAADAEANRQLRELQIRQMGETAAMRADIARASQEATAAERARKAEEAAVKVPVPALNKYQENLMAERTAADVAAKMQQHIEDIDKGRLSLGVAATPGQKALNLLGMSTESSQRLADLQRDLENSRNAILMAAKGVQTDKDAERAMNAIINNLNDPKVVKSALQDLVSNMQNAQNVYRTGMNQLGKSFPGLEHAPMKPLDITARGAKPDQAKPGVPAAPAAPTQPAAPSESITAIDAQGNRIVLRNGQWEPLR